MSQFERNMDYLHKHRITYKRNPVKDKPTEVFDWGSFYEDGTHDPFLMKDMDKAVRRFLKAIDSGERIVVYSDFDADGIPGGALFHDFLKKIGASEVIERDAVSLRQIHVALPSPGDDLCHVSVRRARIHCGCSIDDRLEGLQPH